MIPPPFKLTARPELPAEVEERLGPKHAEMLRDFIEQEVIRDTAKRIAADAYFRGLVTAMGRAKAALVFADRYGATDELQTLIAALPGDHRATISRTLNICRRNDGLEPRMPKNARDGGWVTRRARAARKAADVSSTDLAKSTVP